MLLSKIRILTLLAVSLFPLGCHHNEDSQAKEIAPIPKGAEAAQVIDFKLNLVADIPQTVTRALPKFSKEEEEDELFDPDSVEKSFWNVSFGKIKPEQFEKLKKTYFNNPKLTYNPDRDYEIIDFMPPQIQALASFRFNAEPIASKIPYTLESQPGKTFHYGFETLSNSWNAAYEIARGDNAKTSLFHVGHALAQEVFTNPKYSRSFKEYPLSRKWDTPENHFIRNLDAKPFDVMLVYGRSFGARSVTLQHAAIYIDEDFYFEKTGPDSKLNYRFVRYSEIAAVYSEYRDARVEVRRFEGEKLPPARDLFTYKGRGAKIPKGFTSKALDAELPKLMNAITTLSPSNFEDTEYRSLYLLVEVPIDYDDWTDRYNLSRKAFRSALKQIPAIPQ